MTVPPRRLHNPVESRRTQDADAVARLGGEVQPKYARGGLPPSEAGMWFFAIDVTRVMACRSHGSSLSCSQAVTAR